MNKTLRDTFNILSAPEQRKFKGVIALNILVSIADIASIAVLLYVVSLYTQAKPALRLPQQFGWLGDKNSLMPVSLFAVLFLLKSAAGYAVFVMQYNLIYRTASRISSTQLEQYLNDSYQNYVAVDSSVHVRRIMHEPVEFAHYVLTGIQTVITESALLLLTITVLMLYQAQLFLLLIVVMGPPIALIARYSKRRLKHARANVKTANDTALQYLQEALGSFIESNIYDKHSFFRKRYADRHLLLTRHLSDVQTTAGITTRFMEAFAVAGLFVLIVINKNTGNTVLDITSIGAFIAAAYKIIPGIVKISNVITQIRTYSYTISDLRKLTPVSGKDAAKTALKVSEIEFKNMSFNYPGNASAINFSMHLKSGDFVGLAGTSGIGKSTIINLLLGFIEEKSGDILFNGVKHNAAERMQYWQRISYAQQRCNLINNSVAVNITLAEENYDEAKMKEAISIARLDGFIRQQPDGLNKQITENGRNISGGQRQRINLARALYKDADLLILDEPFSELDEHAETDILKSLQQLQKKGVMILMISHKKENLDYCNKTYIL